MKKILIISLLGIIFTIRPVAAEEPLKWQDIVDRTLEHQPLLKGAALRIDEARQDEKISKSELFPNVSGSSSYRRSKSSDNDWSDAYNHELSGSILLFDGLKTPYAIKAAHKRIDEQQFAYEVDSSDALLNIRTAFVELMEAQQLIKLSQKIHERKKQNLELVQLRYEGGKEHRGAYMTASAELSEAAFDVREAERQLTLSRRTLLISMGFEEMQPIEVTGTFVMSETYLEKPDLNAVLDQIPFLKQLAAAREASLYNSKSTRGDLWPTVSATSSLGRSGERFSGEDNDLSLGVSISVPIFEGGRNSANIRKSHISFLRAEVTEQSGRQQLLLALEDSWKTLIDAIETVDIRKEFLEATDERAKIAAAQYGTGLIDFDDWIIIENNLVSAQRNFLFAQTSMLTAEAGWIHSLGGTLSDKIY
ncbi:MAG: TolC family protein [Candidatus Omnitrophica bacterium]|nr:TolC family protein [Candidatus Omnitrophota bacterium]